MKWNEFNFAAKVEIIERMFLQYNDMSLVKASNHNQNYHYQILVIIILLLRYWSESNITETAMYMKICIKK